ncbi:hypothetical protein BVC93_19445 [Mycobacterium sp. MS1601]|uniref:HdeD family acid-resistance protein n=1 Tax=Mycobacterium sp. MS1601 TaxID=1936029 RepID=UPI000979163D|nr:HdeD family acid-resistance protein [Mycobacterium sp. MS1601]AQA06533.1 hypothetical protein BVC93_19445 [Mycobacterium sp. MS1601]
METKSDGSQQLWKILLLYGLCAAVLGTLILVWPDASVFAAAILFGAYLAVGGVAQIVLAFALPLASTTGRVLMFVSGVCSVVLAVLCFRSIADSVLLLAIWIGVGMIFRGVAQAVSGVTDPELPGRGWIIVSGVLSLAAGFVLLAYPFSSLDVLTLVSGWWLLILGMAEIVSAVRSRRAVGPLPTAAGLMS